MKMEQYESKLSKYLLRKFPNLENPQFTPNGILEIQSYASAESDQIFDKNSGISNQVILAKLLKFDEFNANFIFWHAAYCEFVKLQKDIKNEEIYGLLKYCANNENLKENFLQNKLDFYLIDSFSEHEEKIRIIKLADLFISDIENELKNISIYAFKKEYVYRWLIHIFTILNKSGKIPKDDPLLSKTANQCIDIIKAFHGSSKYFEAYKDNIFAAPLITSTSRLLLEILRISNIEIQNSIIDSLWEYCKNPEFQMREKIEICYCFHEYFTKTAKILDNSQYWDILSNGLAFDDCVVRKYAIKMVKDNLQKFLQEYKDLDKEEISNLWVTFFDIYDTYETYVSHLSKSIWDRVSLIFAYLEKFKTKIYENSHIDALKNMGRWLDALLNRILSLENGKLKKYVVKYLLKIKNFPIPTHAYFYGNFIKLLNTPMFYKEGISHKNENTFYALVPLFVKNFVENSSVEKKKIVNELLKGIGKMMDNQSALLCIFQGFSMIDGDEKFINEPELLIISEILLEKTREFYISKKYKLTKYLTKLLYAHLDSQNTKIDFLLPIFQFFPSAFYNMNCVDLIEPAYKNMLLNLSQEYNLLNVYENIKTLILSVFNIDFTKENPSEIFNPIYEKIKALTKIFGLLLNTLSTMEKNSSEFKKINEISHELFEKLCHNITNPYTNPYSQAFSYALLQKFIRNLIKLVPGQILNFYFIPHIDEFIVIPLSEMLIETMNLFINPTGIKPEHKQKLILFVKYREKLTKLMTDLVILLHVIPTKPSMKLNKIFNYAIGQAKNILEGISKNEQKSAPALAIILSVLECLFGAYVKVMDEKIYGSIIVFEGIFENLLSLLSVLYKMKITETNLDKTYEPIYKTFIGGTEAITIIGISQWKLVKELLIISTIDSKLYSELQKHAPLILQNLRKNAIPVMAGDMLSVLFEISAQCCDILYKNVEELNENDIFEFLELCQDCWEAYKNDLSNSQRIMVEPLFSLVLNKNIIRCEAIRGNKNYLEIIEEILKTAEKCWLLGRAFIGQLLPILINNPEYIRGLEKILEKFALAQEHRGEDNAIILSKAFFLVSAALNKRVIYYDEIDFYGAFTRVVMFEMFEKIIFQTKQNMIKDGWTEFAPETEKANVETRFGKYLGIMESLTKILLSMLSTFAINTKKERVAPMTYTTEYRLRLRIGQFACVLVQVFDPKIANGYFRKILCESDPVLLLIDAFKDALELNNAPILRNYVESALVKLAEQFPSEVLENLIFPAMCNFKSNVQMRTTAAFTACLMLDRINDEKIKIQIVRTLMSYIGSHSAYSRSISQIYVTKYANILPESDQNLLSVFFRYVKEDKTASRINEKVLNQLEGMNKMINKTSAEFVLTPKINDFGEFISEPFVEIVKNAITSVLTVTKEHDDGTTGDLLWKEYFYSEIYIKK